jgi:hypothetical protein
MGRKLRKVAVVAVLFGLVCGVVSVASGAEAATGWKGNPDKKARIWDTMKKYDYKFYAFEKAAWPDRAKWKQVPYEALDYKIVGDAIIENGHFWLFLKSSDRDSPFLYANIDGRPGFCSEIYTRSKRWAYNHRPVYVNILKNTPDEVIVEYSGDWPGKKRPEVIVRYRVRRDTGWIEITPIKNAYQQSHHSSPNRFAVAPSNTEDGADYVVDPHRTPKGKIVEYLLPPDNNRFMLQQVYWGYHDHSMYMLTYPDPNTASPMICGNQLEKLPRLETINALFGGKKVILGVINHRNVFHHEDVDKPITAGGKYVSSWKPPYPGVWRMTGRVTDGKSKYYPDSGTPAESNPSVVRSARADDKYYTNTIVVKQGAENRFTFTSPVEGELEYVIMYLYDRTDETPKGLHTPMDIYREAIGQK